jgi:hypothetical protein
MLRIAAQAISEGDRNAYTSPGPGQIQNCERSATTQGQSVFPGAARGGTVTVTYCRIPFAITARLVVPA